MESLLAWLSANADHAHIWIFFLLVLTGLSVPISEDLMLIASGVLAGTVMPERTIHLFLAVFLGTYFSDNIAYGLGRFCGNKLCHFGWFKKILAPERMQSLNRFLDKYGAWTLFFGRFIPFGVRNGIFMTAGFGKMRFSTFMISDAIACLLFTSLIFFSAYYIGHNYESLMDSLHTAGMITLALSFMTSIILLTLFFRKKYAVRIAS